MAMVSKRDLRHLRSDLGILADKVSKLTGYGGDHHAFGDIAERMRRAGSELGETFSGAGSQARQIGRETLHDVSDRVHDSVGHRLRDQPLVTLAVAVGLGFLLSLIFRRH
jgi:hypothetical protein